MDEIRILIDMIKCVPENVQHSLLDSMVFQAREKGNLEYIFSELFTTMNTDERKYYFTILSKKFDFKEKIRLLSIFENTIHKAECFEYIFKGDINTKIFLFNVAQSNFDSSFKNVKIGKYQSFGLSDYTQTWLLNNKVSYLEDLKLRVHKISNFDLNMLNSLNKFANEEYRKNLSYEDNYYTKKFLLYLKLSQFNFKISTSIMERSKKTFEIKDREIWRDFISNFFKFTETSSDKIVSISATELNEKVEKQVQEALDGIAGFSKEVITQYNAIVCLVCKAFLINIDKKIENKLEALLEYSLDTLNVYLENEIVLLDPFFKNDKSVERTFKKIQGYSKNTKDKILNTVWDMFHVRLLELQMFYDNKKTSNDLYLHYFVSQDKAFKELLLYNPLKLFIIRGDRQFAIRKIGINDILENERLKEKILNEATRRKNMVESVDFDSELTTLFKEIREGQDNHFN